MASLGTLTHLFDESGIATMDWFAPKVTDQIFTSNPLTMQMKSNARTVGGGQKLNMAMIYAKADGSWHSEYATYGHAYKQQLGNAALDWKLYQVPVVLSHLELLINANNPTRRFALAEQKNFIAAKTAADDLGTAMFDITATGAGGGLAIDSLDKAVSDQAEGGAKHVLYAGITRAATGNEAVWNSNVNTTTTILTLGALQTEYGNAQEGDEKVNLMVTTQVLFNKLYNLMTPIQRLGSGLLGQSGFSALLVNGVPVVVDSHCTANYLYGLNMNHIELVAHSLAFFTFEKAMMPGNQWVHVGRYHFVGNVLCHAPRYQFKFTALTA